MPREDAAAHPAALLFSESNSRFLCEVPAARAEDFEALFENLPAANRPLLAQLGEVTANDRLQILSETDSLWIDVEIERLKAAWAETACLVI